MRRKTNPSLDFPHFCRTQRPQASTYRLINSNSQGYPRYESAGTEPTNDQRLANLAAIDVDMEKKLVAQTTSSYITKCIMFYNMTKDDFYLDKARKKIGATHEQSALDEKLHNAYMEAIVDNMMVGQGSFDLENAKEVSKACEV